MEDLAMSSDKPAPLWLSSAVSFGPHYPAAAGLDLHKMYSNDIGAYYIYLQMAVSPVALKYRMSLLLQQTACYILSPLPYCTSVMLSTLHSPSSFLTTALLSLLLAPVSKV